MLPVFSSPVRIVIDCGASRTSLGVFNLNEGGLRCVHSITVQFPVTAVGEDRWLENSITAMRTLNPGGKYSGPVVLVLPAHLTLTKQIKTPRVEPTKRTKVIRFEAEQAIPYALTEVVWASVVSAQRGTGEENMLVAVKREILEQLCLAAQAVGFEPRRILPSTLTTLAGFRLAQPSWAPPALILNLGARSTVLLQVERDRFVARTLALGGASITQQLADNQGCDSEEAERRKVSEGSGALVADAMETLATRLAQEISRSVLHFERQSGIANPAQVFLTGNGSTLAGLGGGLKAKLKIPVVPLEFRNATERNSRHGQTFTDLVGAAAIELLPAQPAMNLLPPRLLEQATRRHRQPWLIATMVLAGAALVPPIVYFRQVDAAAHAKSTALDEALAPLRARDDRNRRNLANLEQLKAQIAQLQSIHDRRAGWLQLFSGLQQRLVQVEDVWLEKLQTFPPAEGGPMKLSVSGRMLDKTNPLAKVSPETFTRLKALLSGFVDLPAVASVEGERFDNSQPGILKFDFVLVIDSAHPL